VKRFDWPTFAMLAVVIVVWWLLYLAPGCDRNGPVQTPPPSSPAGR
jgi:hypothetical protein